VDGVDGDVGWRDLRELSIGTPPECLHRGRATRIDHG
jgi:hypothetical protein